MTVRNNGQLSEVIKFQARLPELRQKHAAVAVRVEALLESGRQQVA